MNFKGEKTMYKLTPDNSPPSSGTTIFASDELFPHCWCPWVQNLTFSKHPMQALFYPIETVIHNQIECT